MAMDDYLARLRRQLKDFSDEQRAALLEEIGNHIESGQQEGRESGSRGVNVLVTELGSPEDLGQGFKAVYRPNRWLDFLLVVIPVYLLFRLIQVLIFGFIYHAQNSEALSLDIRVEILFGIALVGISLWRRSPLLAAFWAPYVMTRLMTLMTREDRWLVGYEKVASQFSGLESAVWTLVLFGTTCTLVWLLWKNCSDLLLIVFALTPFLQMGANLGGYVLALANGFQLKFLNMWDFAWITGITSLAGIYLARRRSVRWLGLALGYAGYSVQMALLFDPRPALIAVWCLPFAIALLAWRFDARQRRRLAERQL